MHGDCRDSALGLIVTTRALAWLVCLQRAAVGAVQRGVAPAVHRERVAVDAIGVRAGSKAGLCEPRRVLDGRAGRVAGCTTARRDGSHGRRAVHFMTGFASNVLLFHVHTVT